MKCNYPLFWASYKVNCPCYCIQIGQNVWDVRPECKATSSVARKKNDGYSKPNHLPLPLFFTASIRLTIMLQSPASDMSNSILEVHFCASERLWARLFKASVSIVWFARTMPIVVRYLVVCLFLWRRKWCRRVSRGVESKRNRKKPLNRLEMYQVMKVLKS